MQIAVALIAISLHWPHTGALSLDQKEISSQSLVTNPIKRATENDTATDRPQSKPVRSDNRRPIWALAHMVNSIKELDYRLGTGANAIEADVTFGPEGDPLWTYHGPPCDCWRHCYQREDFNDFIQYVREISIDTPNGIGRNLSVLFLDLKLDMLDQYGKARAGRELAKAVLGGLFVGGPAARAPDDGGLLHLILSVNHVNDVELVRNFIHTLEINNSSRLLARIGFDVGMNDDLQQIESMWRKLGPALNLWQGDGYTNCFSPFYNLQRLSRAVAKRDNPSDYPAKVYHWTIDLHDRMRESLLLGVDAIMTNHPERLLAVLQEPEMAHEFRLATRDDSPFRKLARRALGRNGETARYQRSAGPSGAGLLGSLYDILASWFNYIREIPLLSLPTTLLRSSGARRTQAPNRTRLAGVTRVELIGGAEYKVDNISSLANDTSDSADRTGGSAGSGGDDPAKKQDLDYQPPWYVSLASNLLVSALRSFLPI